MGLVLCALLAPIEWLLQFSGSRRAMPPQPAGKPRRILVIKFWGMGSIIMASYLIKSLRDAQPDSQITLLTLESNREIAMITGGADCVETLDISRGVLSVLPNIFRMLWHTWKADYDIVLDLEYLTRFTAVVTFASRAQQRVGFYARGFWRGNFHNRRLPFNPYWHVRDNFLNQAAIVGLRGKVPVCIELDPGEEGRKEAKKLLEVLAVSRRYIIVNPNAGETSLERRWPADRFAELVDKIYLEYGMSSLLIGAKKEWDTAESVVRKTKSGKAINIAGRTSVRGLTAILGDAEAVVSNDSGPLHLASHAGAKVVGLFGPETPVLWGPIGKDAFHVKIFFRNLDCSPCINIHNMKTVKCLRDGAECLTEITADEVLNALRELIGPAPGREAP